MKRLVRKVIPTNNYNPLSPHSPVGLGLQVHEDAFEQGLVLDVITNDEYDGPFKGDGYEVGMVQFRFMSAAGLPAANASWASPLFSNFSEYPLTGELVYVFRSMNRWWYLTKFNMSNRVTTQDMPELLTETDVSISDKDKSDTYKSINTPQKIGGQKKTNVIGKYFADIPEVYRLKHLEGDTVFEGRSGQSIRFGTSWINQKPPFKSLYGDQAPNILLRVGADLTAQKTNSGSFALVVEDINKDASSIWVTSDQVVDLNYATQDSDIHTTTTEFPSQPNGNQIVVNTDRFIINTKSDRILGSSYGGISWKTLLDYTVDAGQDNISYTARDMGITVGNDRLANVVNDDSVIVGNNQTSHANKNIYLTAGETMYIGAQENMALMSGNTISIKGSKVIIGDTESTEEPMVCGSSLAAFLAALIDALVGNPVPTATPTPGVNAQMHIMTTGAPGSPSAINPAIVASLMQLKADVLNGGGAYASFNSRLGFVKKLP